MTVHGIHPQQTSHPQHSQSRHPALGPVGFMIEEVELLVEGRLKLTGPAIVERAMINRIQEVMAVDRMRYQDLGIDTS